MKSRKELIKSLRKEVNIDAYSTYSNQRKDHQHVKFYIVTKPVETFNLIKKFLAENNITDVTLELTDPVRSWMTRNRSVVMRFPFSEYK